MAIACMRCPLSITVFSPFCNAAFVLLSFTDAKKYTLIKGLFKGPFSGRRKGPFKKDFDSYRGFKEHKNRVDTVYRKEQYLAKGQESLLTSVVAKVVRSPIGRKCESGREGEDGPLIQGLDEASAQVWIDRSLGIPGQFQFFASTLSASGAVRTRYPIPLFISDSVPSGIMPGVPYVDIQRVLPETSMLSLTGVILAVTPVSFMLLITRPAFSA